MIYLAGVLLLALVVYEILRCARRREPTDEELLGALSVMRPQYLDELQQKLLALPRVNSRSVSVLKLYARYNELCNAGLADWGTYCGNPKLGFDICTYRRVSETEHQQRVASRMQRMVATSK